MEIQRVYSEIEGQEKLYSVLMSEEELSLFSKIQKEFNSKSQKALRKVWDFKKGLEAIAKGKHEVRGFFPVKIMEDEIRLAGRNYNRFESIMEKGGGIHHSINNKVLNQTGGYSVSGRQVDGMIADIPRNLRELKLNNRGIENKTKYTRRAKGVPKYDYNYDYKREYPGSFRENKEIMKAARGL